MPGTLAMILAAGRGERMRPLTDKVPKALLQVSGLSLIGHHLARLRRAGVATVVINLGWLGEMIVAEVGDGSRFDLQVVYSPEHDHVLETGGGIRRALPLLGHDPFWVLNADVFSDIGLPDIALPPTCPGHLILVPTPSYKAGGDFDLVDGKVRNAALPSLTFSGIALYRPELFEGHGPGRFPLTPLLRAAADDGRLEGHIYDGLWEDVGTPERLLQLNRSVASEND